VKRGGRGLGTNRNANCQTGPHVEINTMPPEQSALEFERQKWRDEYELREREIKVKEREASRSRWSSPLVLAVLAAAIAALGNAAAIWLTGRSQHDLETTKAEQTRVLEEGKAEAARILEMIKTGDPEKAADNLKFLLDAGLISDADRRKNIQNFLAHRPAGKGPALPVGAPSGDPRSSFLSVLRSSSSFGDRINTLRQRLKEDNLTAQEREKLTKELSTLEFWSDAMQARPK